ncbi:3-hydroxyacyl-CoA dehydrogenase [Mesorhizobium sp. M7A.F.Ca.US.006.04.2.1]|uniref:3-hydroxyacyl-CoA dehydrogenase NAD-binding domain-containing protein n=1 Tax=unclassified Mesorhizobium TaxID=325217 RepID=UPI000FCCDC78|nr:MULTISPECIES: 3-hydroxyacyl-CoA dehydrogenase NAD-binding domain-containing protein [unclassified Mesorhizobium]RUX78354.1 3-hydroxyacyl-CoA dehydrogenase [Mesorhizobium sp. M7A.F.Ca.US.005.03.1.1]RUY13817.1 3-hydroxyacyl-CoA dehydrogenase [Mesorhizobium sp. M7A.F.Ca.US.005.03.2.1]RUY25658.1 3-hydroxyacyl-CoA dehydrogenase [Mesorhizobium sp. M7A.F.Ca.US.001.04.2.1]RUY40874.1 3-hydroxyacyl-CoA dehydrogenase [Mesorhizobium sp. M7A.F.Ca.US.001.04.1.1]RUZ96850.1 3-hydroxyacyl-CoA dehydrogenase 
MMEKLTIGIVGFGVIGQRWTACFAHAGHAVRVFDPTERREAAFNEVLPALMADLDALKGSSPSPGEIHLFPTLAETLQGVDFVQENGPEDLALKRRLLAEIEDHVGDEVVIASSSSALLVSDMQGECRLPGRVVLGHPFNPAHLMPLVEIVGGKTSDPQAIARARAIYEAIGKKPVTLNREATGHIALRLMGAMWREAIALVRDGVASVEDVDRAFMYGPGAKWTLQGSFISNSLNADGIEDFLRKYGPTYQAIWDTLLDAKLDSETIRSITASTNAAVGGRSHEDLKAAREPGLVGILKTVAAHGAL